MKSWQLCGSTAQFHFACYDTCLRLWVSKLINLLVSSSWWKFSSVYGAVVLLHYDRSSKQWDWSSNKPKVCVVCCEWGKREKRVQVGGSVGHEIRAVTLKTATEIVPLMMIFETSTESWLHVTICHKCERIGIRIKVLINFKCCVMNSFGLPSHKENCVGCGESTFFYYLIESE